jgi:hypothetical protein
VPTLSLATTSSPRDSVQTDHLAREWVITFAELYRVSLKERGPRFVDLWVAAVSDLDPAVLDAACKRTMQTCKFFPTPADIRGHIDHTEETATSQAAEIGWQRVMKIRRVDWNPDIPASLQRALAKLSERVQQAARAAGVFRDFESTEELHVWAKKRFIESFIAYGELERDEFLLPDGEIKNLLSEFAQTKMLPSTSDDWSECRARGEAYRTQLATQGIPDLSPEERLRIADELAAEARKLLDQQREHVHVVTVSDEKREALRYQAELIRARYPKDFTDPVLRKYVDARS